MLPQVQPLPGAISEILASASRNGCLTTADRYGLMAALLEESLSEEEMRAINRLLRAVNRGWIQVTNDSHSQVA
jgi:hypothetical protein